MCKWRSWKHGSSPDANIVLDIESDNAVIQINQKDADNDS